MPVFNMQRAIREILLDVQRRMPAGQRLVPEAFSTAHGRPVLVALRELEPDTFYWFDEFAVCAFREAILDWSSRQGTGAVTISCPAFGEFQAQRKRFEHLAGKIGSFRVLTAGAGKSDTGTVDVAPVNGNALRRYRVALREGRPGVLFVAREERNHRLAGFFTLDAETIEEVADDLDQVLAGRARSVRSFDRLATVHQTTQRVNRELEEYSRRMELAIARAHRRPDLLTPARLDRIIRQSIVKMEELKEIPLRALRALDDGSGKRLRGR